jgi:hypothetical protein
VLGLAVLGWSGCAGLVRLCWVGLDVLGLGVLGLVVLGPVTGCAGLASGCAGSGCAGLVWLCWVGLSNWVGVAVLVR